MPIFSLNELSEDTQKLFDLLDKEPDFIQIIIGTSYLDNCLASILKNFFIEDKLSDEVLSPEHNGILSSFNSRIKIAYLLGLMNESIYNDLLILAKIRNKFAHVHLGMDYSSIPVNKLMNKLLFLEQMVKDKKAIFPDFSRSHDKVFLTIVMISQILFVSGLSVRHLLKNEKFKMLK